MRIFSLTISFLKNRPLITFLNILLFSLAISVLVVLAKIDHHVQHRLEKDAAGIDMVVGAKGSPLQLILSSIYHLDVPPGNIPLKSIETLSQNKYVRHAIPISLGDSYYGYHIVGTKPEFLTLYQAQFKSGKMWQAPMEAILGAEVAEQSRLQIGDRFAGNHGLVSKGASTHVHIDTPYKVVGILEKKNNIIDRLVLTNLRSVWEIHNHEIEDMSAHDEEEASGYEEPSNLEITALLVQFKTPIAGLSLPREINKNTNWQAALPAMEISRLLHLLGFGMNALRAFGLLLLGISTLSLFVMLINVMQKRQYDLAVMRCLGASRLRVSLQILSESLAIAVMGLLLGFGMGYGLTAYLPHLFKDGYLSGIPLWQILPMEYTLIGITLSIGILASLIPACQAYKTNIHTLLMEN